MKHITQQLELDEARTLMISIEPFYLGKDESCWFDDVELIKLY